MFSSWHKVEEVRVGGCKRRSGRTCTLGRDAVGEADRARRPVVVASAEQPGPSRERRVHDRWLGETELGEIERSVLLGCAFESHEVIEHLGDTHRGERRQRLSRQQLAHGGRRCLTLEQGAHGIGIKD